MWAFFVLFIIILFVISQILIGINNKIYSGIKIFFKIIGAILAVFLVIYVFISIINAAFGIFTDSILEGFRDFLRGFGF